jgi:hypothetical protein
MIILLENQQEIRNLFIYFGKKLFEVKEKYPVLYYNSLMDLDEFYNENVNYFTKLSGFISVDVLDYDMDERIKNSLLDMCNALDKILNMK